MADSDPSTIVSVTALIAAVIAMVIALAQAVQQYFITGQLIRICDSVVFGPMPGQGRRVWQLSQFRFRVLYSIPQISLSTDLWPSGSGYHVKSYAIGRYPLPGLAGGADDIHETKRRNVRIEREEEDGDVYVITRHLDVVPTSKRRHLFQRRLFYISWWKMLFRRKAFSWSWWKRLFRRKLFSPSRWSSPVTGRRARPTYTSSSSARSNTETIDSRRVGEASWVSFCRAIEMPCGNSVQFDHVQYDADRCPSDLVSAPMQVSMRDIIIMGLMAGMEVTSASFGEKSVSMQGAVGTITSSKHAVLGPILHFTPRNTDEGPAYTFGYPFGHVRGFVDGYWIARTWDVCCVARRYLNWRARRTARRLDDRWVRDLDKSTWNLPNDSTSDEERQFGGTEYSFRRRNRKGWTRDIILQEEKAGGHRRKRPGAEGDESNGRGREVIKTGRAIPEALPQDGEWTIRIPPRLPTGQVAPSTVDQQGNMNKSGQEPEVSTADNEPETPDEAHTTPEPPGSPSQEDAMPKDRLRKPRPRQWATVEDVSDHEGVSPSNGPVSEAQNLPFGTEAVAEAAFQKRPEKSTPTSPVISRRATVEDETSSREAKETTVIGEERLERTDVGGLQFHPKLPENNETSSTIASRKIRNRFERGLNAKSTDRIDVFDLHIDNEKLSERGQTAKKLQASRAEKLRQVQRDKEIVEDSVKRGVISSPYDEAAGQGTQLMLTNYAHNGEEVGGGSSRNAWSASEDDPLPEEKQTKEEQEARERELKRELERREREIARDQRNRTRNRASELKNVDLYWMSQMDVMRGYWATPWHGPSTTPLYSALTGCVTVVLEALLGFLESEYIIYTNQNFYTTAVWMCERNPGEGESSYNHSYPAYAHNARGGVITTGHYVGCCITSFPSRVVPVLELAYSYDWQVDDSPRDRTEVEVQNVELMRIDSWLSYVGRLNEISEGPHRLLHQTPALVYLLMQEFEIDFQNIDLSATEGGLQDIQGLAANVMDFLTDEELTEAEQLYVLVALLRGVKVAQCVLAGSDTAALDDILRKDVQAHLV
ncbi:unnamed protein product [Alternaria alternata]